LKNKKEEQSKTIIPVYTAYHGEYINICFKKEETINKHNSFPFIWYNIFNIYLIAIVTKSHWTGCCLKSIPSTCMYHMQLLVPGQPDRTHRDGCLSAVWQTSVDPPPSPRHVHVSHQAFLQSFRDAGRSTLSACSQTTCSWASFIMRT